MDYDKSAFPLYHVTTEPVITLRDWFAGLAMQALILRSVAQSVLSINAYELADTMLEEREKGNES